MRYIQQVRESTSKLWKDAKVIGMHFQDYAIEYEDYYLRNYKGICMR